jgi:site-specific DNA-methyltransferase (cytosine-N4-specific)
MSRSDHRRRDEMMIGNREVTERLRKGYWTTFGARGRELPDSVRRLISNIADLNDGADVGFRRKNMAALLAKYFFDMQAVLAGIRDILKPRGYAFVVVGNNHTIAGGKRVDICTASLLSEVASALGLEVCETLNMEMLTSRDIFRKNAMASEEILVLRKDAQR